MQVLLNLQSNALKFTIQGQVKIVVEIVDQEMCSWLKVQVVDSGVGISAENQKKLFKLFGFVNDTQAMNTKGIGLGLVISDKIVSYLGGKFEVQSELNQGTNFTFTIRLDE